MQPIISRRKGLLNRVDCRVADTRAASDNVTHGSWIIIAVALGALLVGTLAIPGGPVHHWLTCNVHSITDISGSAVDANACTTQASTAAIFTTPAPSPMAGYEVPAGSTESVSGSYAPNTAAMAVDGDLSTWWDSGGDTGTYTITFPQAVSLSALDIAASASPATDEVYTIYGYNDGQTPIEIAEVTEDITVNNPNYDLVSIPLSGFTDYQNLAISINGESSWVDINELSFVPR